MTNKNLQLKIEPFKRCIVPNSVTNGRRTNPLLSLSPEQSLLIRFFYPLAYYPPSYYSKYNPIERTWAVLENQWNGSLLDEVETALNMAANMTWKGKHPVVKLVHETYETGVNLLTKKAMSQVERQIERLTNSNNKLFVRV